MNALFAIERLKSKHVPADLSLPRRVVGPGEYLRMLANDDPTVFDCDLKEPPKEILDKDFLMNLINVQPMASHRYFKGNT